MTLQSIGASRGARVFLGALFALGLLSGRGISAQEVQVPPDLILQNVNVIDVREGSVLLDRDVVIRAGQIITIAPTGTVERVGGETTLNGSGGFLIPGLMDMHAHLRGDALPGWVTTDWFMPLLLAHGVTGVREMTSDCEEPTPARICLTQMQEWKAQIEAGTVLGPRLLALSTWQVNPPWTYEISEDQAREVVGHFAQQGVDLIKIYQRTSPLSFARLMTEARRQGIAVAGHIPIRVSAIEASNMGLRSMEHARDFLFDCFPGSSEFRNTSQSLDPPTPVMQAMVRDHDPAACEEIFRTFAANETWYVPTHLTRRFEAFAGDPSLSGDPRMRYIPEWLKSGWINDANATVARDSTAAGRQARMDFYLKGLEITGAAHRAGVRTLLGTDAGDSFVFPGSSVHDELAELVKAGLSPAEALRAATLDAAEFLDVEGRYGSIEPGKRADLVLLSANPLSDIGNVREIRAVVFGGGVLDRERLDLLLRQAETAAARPLGQGDPP